MTIERLRSFALFSARGMAYFLDAPEKKVLKFRTLDRR